MKFAGEHAFMEVGAVLAEAAEGLLDAVADRAGVYIDAFVVNALAVLIGPDRPLVDSIGLVALAP